MAKEKEFKISITGMTGGYITAENEELAVKKFLRQLILTTNKGKTYKDFKIIGPFDLVEIEGDKMNNLPHNNEKEKEYETMKSIIEELKAVARKENYTMNELLHPVRKLSDLPFDPIKVHEPESSDVVMEIIKNRTKTNEKLYVLPEFINLDESCNGFKEGVLYKWNKMTCRYEQYNTETEQFEPMHKEEE